MFDKDRDGSGQDLRVKVRTLWAWQCNAVEFKKCRVCPTRSVKAGEVLYFPLVQECEKGVSRWIDVKGRPSADAPDDENHDPEKQEHQEPVGIAAPAASMRRTA